MRLPWPFTVHWVTNWKQNGVGGIGGDREWRAVVHLSDGRVVERKVSL